MRGKKTCPGACTGAHGTYSGLKTSLAPAFGEKFRNEDQEVWEALVQSYIKFNRFPEKVLEKIWEALVPSQVRFNRVPEKVLKKVSEKVGKALVQSQAKFNKVPEKVLEKIWGASVQSEVGFNRFPEKVLEKFAGNHGAKPSQVQRVPGEGCGEGPGEGFVFSSGPGQVQQVQHGFRRLAPQHASE